MVSAKVVPGNPVDLSVLASHRDRRHPEGGARRPAQEGCGQVPGGYVSSLTTFVTFLFRLQLTDRAQEGRDEEAAVAKVSLVARLS